MNKSLLPSKFENFQDSSAWQTSRLVSGTTINTFENLHGERCLRATQPENWFIAEADPEIL